MRPQPSRPPRRSRRTPGPWLVALAWVLFFAALAPLALQYTHSLDYAGTASTIPGSESARAQSLLDANSSSGSTLIVAVDLSHVPPSAAANDTARFQEAVAGAGLPYFGGTHSVYTAFAGYLDGVFAPHLVQTRILAASVDNLTISVYGFPERFLAAWAAAGGTSAAINATFSELNGSDSGYEGSFRAALTTNFSISASLSAQVQAAVTAAAGPYFASGLPLNLTLRDANVTSYRSSGPAITVALLAAAGASGVPESWVTAATESGDFGTNVVKADGLAGLPASLRSVFLSPDGSLAVIDVEFTVPDSFRTADGTYPAQAATPAVRSLANAAFGTAALVTGAGAAAYDSQQLANASGLLFALTFVFLGIAVGLTLRSWIAPLLALVLVSLSTVIGYLAIELTGLWFGKVDFTVTYTLTAVTLGVATDYALFLMYRYREELARGASPLEALETARSRSGSAIVVSALTVAVGLASLSFLSGLATWGPVLALTILGIAALEVTLLPVLLRWIGPRLFVRRWLRPAPDPASSRFYAAAARSGARPWTVVALAVMVAVPAVASFLLVPTSYDIAGGLPAGTPSGQGQQLIEQRFGANLLYPTYVIVGASTTFEENNGSLSPEAAATLPGVARSLLRYPGVTAVEGPYVSGENLSYGTNATAASTPYLLEGGRAAYFTVYASDGPYSSGALTLVSELRANASYLVGGLTSSVLDQQALNDRQYPLVELLLAAFLAVVLGLAFGSVAAPAVSLSGIFLSVAVTTGLLYLIAQYLLHAALLWLIPLILFVLLMSLGNDYTVFLLARIREEQAVRGPVEGIRRGVAGSGVAVSALGLILAASLGSLALQPITFLQEIGIAFVLSLLIDTFLVRPFYFPAVLTLVERGRARRARARAPAE